MGNNNNPIEKNYIIVNYNNVNYNIYDQNLTIPYFKKYFNYFLNKFRKFLPNWALNLNRLTKHPFFFFFFFLRNVMF